MNKTKILKFLEAVRDVNSDDLKNPNLSSTETLFIKGKINMVADIIESIKSGRYDN